MAAPSEGSAAPPPPALGTVAKEAPRLPRDRIYSAGRHLRAALLLLAISILVLGAAYPLALVGFGSLVDPSAAHGSLTYDPNGTVNGSRLLPSNTTSTIGNPTPLPGPAAPALGPAIGPETGPAAALPTDHLRPPGPPVARLAPGGSPRGGGG